MKTKSFGVLGACLALLFSISGPTKAQMSLNGEIRPRMEYRHGFQSLIDSGQSASVFTSQRTRLNFGYASENFKAGVSVQDIRIWGSQSVGNSTDGYTSFHEAWGEYNLCPRLSVKAGRQELSYDDERLFETGKWVQQGKSHDLVLLKFTDTAMKFTIHAGEAYNQNSTVGNIGTSYTINSYKEMQFLWLNKKFADLSVSVLALNHGSQSPVSINSTRYFQTIGTYLEYKKNNFFASTRFYYQTGVDATLKDMQAYMGGIDVAYTLIKKLTLGAGMETLSGQSQTDTTKAYRDVSHAFNTLYGATHKFNGYMDYFYASPFGNVGLQDIYLKIKYREEKWWAAIDLHLFSAAANVLDVKELASSGKYAAMNSNLGTEIDFTCMYNFSKTFSVQAGYSQMLATETLQTLKGGKKDIAQNWSYLMLIFKPDFLK